MNVLRRSIALVSILAAIAAARGTARAQTDTTSPSDAEMHLARGLALEQKADYPGATGELERALAAFEAQHDARRVIVAQRSLAAIATLTGQWERARTFREQALANAEALGDVHSEAQVLFEMTNDGQAPLEERVQALARADAVARTTGDTRLIAAIAHRSGDFAFTRGDFATAIERLQVAIDLYEADGADEELARALTSLGRIQRAHGHPEVAVDMYRRALRIQNRVGDRQGVIQSMNAMAVALDSQKGRRGEALDIYRRALALARETGSPRIVAFQLGNLGGAYLVRREFAKAATLLREALDETQERFLVTVREVQLAQAYLGLGRLRDALAMSDRAVADARADDARDQLLRALSDRASVLRALGRTGDALAARREALATFEEIRARLVPTDFMKASFAKQYEDLITGTIDLLTAVGHADEALEAAERARGRALVDLLASRGLEEPARRVTPPPSGGAVQLTLRGGRTAAPESSLAQKAISIDELHETARRLDSTLLVYYSARDALYIWTIDRGRGPAHAVKVPVSRSRLLELVTAAQPQLAAAPASATVAQPIRSGGMAVAPVATPHAPLRTLERLLVDPVQPYLPHTPGARVTIVPHGPLFLLSFAALRDARGAYLLERYTLTYAPSVGMLRYTADHARRAAERPTHYLFVADPSDPPLQPNLDPMPPLPGARREVALIARDLPPDAVSTLTGSDASETAVRERINDATVIHLATHGVAVGADPLDAFVALGRSDKRSDDSDGRLTAAEVYRLDLTADLVVLSACRTLLASESDDGIAGLTRAFLSAGAASIVATMWDVADETTVRLMPAFYDRRTAGQSKAEALRGAQLRLLRDLRAGRVKIGATVLAEDPFFWAGFTLIGEP